MWYFAWILGVSLAVLLATASSVMHDAKAGMEETSIDEHEC